MANLSWQRILLAFAAVKITFHLFTNGLWSFHRDELLYLALGRHLDWGYASVPPSIAAFAWAGTNLLGGSVEGIRLISTLFGTGILVLTGLMAKEMGGGRLAVFFACLAALLSPAYLRPSLLFQPVAFDIFYWALLSWMVVKLVNTGDKKWLLWMGAAFGLSLLNKYLPLLFAAGLLPGLLLTEHRKLLKSRHLYLAAGIAGLVFLPNLLWQARHGFPVAGHMEGLAESQLVNVNPASFFLDQIFDNLPALPLWVAGLVFLLFKKDGRPWRMLGWMHLTVVALLLVLSGKSYYALGCYPALIAAGAVFFEKTSAKAGLSPEQSGRSRNLGGWRWLRFAIPAFMLAVALPLLPAALPVLNPEKTARWFEKRKDVPGLNAALRWEDGNFYPLPQDFADMLGWEELAGIVVQTWRSLPDKNTAAIYAENYGQAGAIEHFGRREGLPNVLSFSDNYRYWLPGSLPADLSAFIYVNDELGDDMPGFFEEIKEVGRVQNPLARENGTQVYLCQKPTPGFFQRMSEAAKSFRPKPGSCR